MSTLATTAVGPSRTGRMDFMNRMVSLYPDKELHVIRITSTPISLNTTGGYPSTPMSTSTISPHASQLNQIEVWPSILTRQALQELSAASVRDVFRAIDAFSDAHNQHPMPFEWTKSVSQTSSIYAGRH